MTEGIYGLREKTSYEYRYVGRSKNIERRYEEHLRTAAMQFSMQYPVYRWIKKAKFLVLCDILEETPDTVVREMVWLNALKESGCRLLNIVGHTQQANKLYVEPRVCSVRGCEAPCYQGALLCVTHVTRKRRYGSLEPHPRHYEDLTGRRFGTLIVQERIPEANAWSCLCDCGNIRVTRLWNLKNEGNSNTCGDRSVHPVWNKSLTEAWPSAEELAHEIETKGYAVIEKRFKTTRRSIRNYISASGVEPPLVRAGARIKDHGIEWPVTSVLLQMVLDSGYGEVAEKLGVSYEAVRSRLRREGILPSKIKRDWQGNQLIDGTLKLP